MERTPSAFRAHCFVAVSLVHMHMHSAATQTLYAALSARARERARDACVYAMSVWAERDQPRRQRYSNFIDKHAGKYRRE